LAGRKNEPVQPATFQQKLPFILKHIALACRIKGEKLGMLEMRKQLAFYVKGLPNSAVARASLVKVCTQQEAGKILSAL
jgi:tRNA-dihydrouridine synthase B